MQIKEKRKKSKVKNQERMRSMSSTPSLRGHHTKSYAMNAYLTKGLSKRKSKAKKGSINKENGK
jgi:hypothetical protein